MDDPKDDLKDEEEMADDFDSKPISPILDDELDVLDEHESLDALADEEEEEDDDLIDVDYE